MFREDTSRLNSQKMEYYREVYRNSPRWNGSESLDGKNIVIYCEQGIGDQLQFARYVPVLKEKYDCHVTLHCNAELLRLFEKLKTHVDVLDRNDMELPNHDFHLTSMSLPFALQNFDAPCDYLLDIPKMSDIEADTSSYKIGIVWEGNPAHSNGNERNCPLKHFLIIKEALNHSQKPLKLFSLQKHYHNLSLLTGVEDIELYSAPLEDMLETASLVNSMDAVICVDTAVLHLAGTLKRPTWGMLSQRHDHRWAVRKWYDTMTLVKQDTPDDWEWVMYEIGSHLKDITQP
jgi:ADP-heptose:LPS heptosyltransferase